MLCRLVVYHLCAHFFSTEQVKLTCIHYHRNGLRLFRNSLMLLVMWLPPQRWWTRWSTNCTATSGLITCQMMNCEYLGYAMIFTLHFIHLVTLKYVYLENKIQRSYETILASLTTMERRTLSVMTKFYLVRCKRRILVLQFKSNHPMFLVQYRCILPKSRVLFCWL